MADPTIKYDPFATGASFDDAANRTRAERFLKATRRKLGALTADDLEDGVLKPRGPIDARSHQVSHVREAAGVVNVLEAMSSLGVGIHTLIANMTTGGIALIPPDTSIGVSHTIEIPDDVQIVGCGPSSVLYQDQAVTTPVMIDGSGSRRWAVRSLSLVGKRSLLTRGTAIVAKNTTKMDAQIENVVFGPQRNDGSVTFMWPSRCLSLSGVDSVKVLACRMVGGDVGVDLHGVSDVEISACKITRCNVGLKSRGDSWVRVLNNRVWKSVRQNLHLSSSEHVVVLANQIENASTGTPGASDSIYGNDMSSFIACGNLLRDRSGYALTSRYAVNHHTTNKAEDTVLTCNYVGETSGLATLGHLVNLRTSLNAAASVATASGFVRDNNNMFSSGLRAVATYDGGWRGSRLGRAWNARRSTTANIDNPGTRYEQVFGNNGMDHGHEVPGVYSAPQTGGNERFDWWTDTGAIADARLIQYDELVRKTSSPGALLTPAVIATQMSHAEREIGAVQATYGMYEPRAGEVSEHPGGLLRSVAAGVYASTNYSTYYWGRHIGSGAAFNLTNSQFGLYVTSLTPYPANGTGTPHALSKYPGKVIVAWGGLVYGGSGLYAGPGGVGGSFGQRPTWLTVHA